jgi:hypothetical protein
MKGADVNEGKFVLNIDALFALYNCFKSRSLRIMKQDSI